MEGWHHVDEPTHEAGFHRRTPRSGRPGDHGAGDRRAGSGARPRGGRRRAGGRPSAKIRTKLSERLKDKGRATFWVRFTQADLTKAAAIRDRDRRGQAVYDTLTKAARDAQAGTEALLDDEGATYTSFWATNAIRVESGDTALVERIAQDASVAGPLCRPSTTAWRSRSRRDRSRRPTRSSGASRTSTPTTCGASSASGARASSWAASTPACSTTTQPWSTTTAATTGTAPSTRTTTGSTPPGRATVLPATTTATAPTRWARWSATTAGATRSGSPRERPGSPPTAAAPPTRR